MRSGCSVLAASPAMTAAGRTGRRRASSRARRDAFRFGAYSVLVTPQNTWTGDMTMFSSLVLRAWGEKNWPSGR